MTPEIVDTLHDTNATMLNRILQIYKPPAFVKEAARTDTATEKDLRDNEFAYPIGRRYPCHNKAATWLNYAYFLENKKLHSPTTASIIQKNFEKFAQLWNIELPQPKHTKSASHKKIAYDLSELPKEKFALYYDDGKTKVMQYPLVNADLVKTAAEDFTTRTCSLYPRNIRKQMAQQILKAAEDYNVELDYRERASLETIAGKSIVIPHKAASNMRIRYQAKPKEIRDKANKLAEKLEKTAADKITEEQKEYYIEQLEQLDKEAGYKKRMLLPEHIICMSETEAKQFRQNHFKLAGCAFKIDELKNLSNDQLIKLIDENIVNRFSHPLTGEIDFPKLAHHLESLPAEKTTKLRLVLERL